MIDKLVSGGQTGADQGALRAARAAGIPTGGWAPKGWLTEGPLDEEGHPWPKEVTAPWLADFGLVECPEPGYPARTRANVRDSDATLWFGDWHTTGGRATLDACKLQNKPFLLVFGALTRPSEVVWWLDDTGVRVLNVAGNREGIAPGIGERTEYFLGVVFRRLARRG